MTMIEWAKNELDRLLVDDEDGMQAEINNDILEIVKVFANQGHSGFSASYALNIIKRLLDWKPITPLTGEDDEWNDVPEWDDGRKVQQNKRCSAVFRENYDNSTAYYIGAKVFSDDGGNTWFTKGGRGSSIPVVFPFKVPEKPEYIILPPESSESTE
jgi:hypothetical protein